MNRLATAVLLFFLVPTALAADPALSEDAKRVIRSACLDGDPAACHLLSRQVAPDTGDGLASLEEPALTRTPTCEARPSFAALFDDEAPSARGLDAEEIARSMERFLPKTVSCLDGGPMVQASWRVEVDVDCSGRVTEAEVVDAGVLPDSVVACLEHLLLDASFPAHDDPEGVSFVYPARFVAKRHH